MLLNSKYDFKIIENDALWDNVVARSPQGTIFSESVYLNALGRKFKRFGIYKGEQLKAGVAVIESDDGRCCEIDDLVIYNGLLFLEDDTQKEVKARHERFELTTLTIAELDKRYEGIEMALAPQYQDMRPFLWYNYDNEGTKFNNDLRYTSYLCINELKENKKETETELFKNLETIRQRNIREARKNNISVEKELNNSLFIKYYVNLLEAQGHKPPNEKLNRMQNLIDVLIKKERAVGFSTFDEGRNILYKTIFCFDNKRAYYLFGAGDQNSKDRYKGTICFWDAFRNLAKDYSISFVDLEGVNSPYRGWFKLSFGGNLLPYYEVRKSNRIDNNFKN